MKGKLKLSIASIVIIGVLATIGFASFLNNSGLMLRVNLTVYASGTPDGYANKICMLNFYQNGSGAFLLSAYVTNDSYSAGAPVNITANTPTIIGAEVYYNVSLASSESDAIAKIRIYINISGVVTNGLFVSSAATGSIHEGCYWERFYYPSLLATTPTSVWTPVASTNYTITILYQAYY